MRVFAIGDLHLPGGDDKPMNVFGAQWTGHFNRIREDWSARVGEEDAVLIPGDISWAMQLEDAVPDLLSIGELPGKKVLLRGNHDYWWGSVTRVRDALPRDMYVIQNDALKLEDTVICGSRGWTGEETAEDKKIFSRELLRLEMSLRRASELGGRMIVMCHYPPCGENGAETEVTRLIGQYPVSDVVYGHLHGTQVNAFNGMISGIRYYCVSCDQIGFALKLLPDETEKTE